MVQINDVGGLSKPLTKLIDVVASGIGAVFRPWLMVREAKAEREQRRILEENGDPVQPLSLAPPADNATAIERATPPWIESLQQRVQARVDHQEEKRQRNIESIVFQSVRELPEHVSDEPVDPDWTARFVSAAQDVSTTEMQVLWSKVLAGEVAAPGLFSLRSLEILKNLTTRDAHKFREYAQFAVRCGAVMACIKVSEKFHDQHARHDTMIYLQELGLLNPTSTTNITINDKVVWIYGSKLLEISCSRQLRFPASIYSLVGREIRSLEKHSENEEYLSELVEALVKRGATVEKYNIISENSATGEIEYDKKLNKDSPS